MAMLIDGVKYVFQDELREEHQKVPRRQVINPEVQYDIQDEQDISEPTEMGEALRELNNDGMEKDSRMSGIDMRTRLHYIEVSSILAVDALVGFRFLPVSLLHFTRQKKRLAVSLAGKGREEIVSIVHGKTEQDQKKGGGWFSKAFGGKPAQQQQQQQM